VDNISNSIGGIWNTFSQTPQPAPQEKGKEGPKDARGKTESPSDIGLTDSDEDDGHKKGRTRGKETGAQNS